MEIQSLDLREQRCPMALLLAKRACVSLAQGQQLAIYVTDPGAKSDIPRYLMNNGYRFKCQESDDATVFTVSKL